jgi:single-stranded DNA-binding protein
MMNAVILEGVLADKPVLLESKTGVACEFNLDHSDLTGTEPARYSWRCRAVGAQAQTLAESGSKGQTVFLQGRLVQELVTNGDQQLAVVKLLVESVRLIPLVRRT